MPEIKFIKRLEAAPKAKTQIHALARPARHAKAVAEFAKTFGVESKRAVQAQDAGAVHLQRRAAHRRAVQGLGRDPLPGRDPLAARRRQDAHRRSPTPRRTSSPSPR